MRIACIVQMQRGSVGAYALICLPLRLIIHGFSIFTDMTDNKGKNSPQDNKMQISVFEYLDARKYLIDAFAQLNEQTAGKYSYRFIAQQLKVGSKTTIGRLFSGERKNIPIQMIGGFSRILKHTRAETVFFDILVHFGEAKTIKDKEEYYQKLMSLPKPVPKTQLRHFEYEFFKEWYISVIRELITMYKFDGNYQELADKVRPAITAKQATHAVTVLESLGMIVKDAQGWYIQKSVAITSKSEARNLAILQHQMQHMDLVKKSIMLNQQENDYKISTATFGVNEEGFKEILKRVSEFQKELVNLMAKYDNCMDKVYQFNMLLYPLSHRVQDRAQKHAAQQQDCTSEAVTTQKKSVESQ
jgi:uncharacterized protein (TIGR02147 family)